MFDVMSGSENTKKSVLALGGWDHGKLPLLSQSRIAGEFIKATPLLALAFWTSLASMLFIRHDDVELSAECRFFF